MKSIKFGSKIIGGNSYPLIIAEIGINHLGNFSLCKKMIKAASNSGADVVKLQTINVDESYMNNTLSYKVFKNTNFNQDQLKELYKYAKKNNLELFTTPGDISSIKKIKPLNFPGIKISSGLMTNIPLIEEAIKLSKPIIISTGMAFKKELSKVINIFKKNNFKKYVVLQCTAKYPNDDKDVNLNSMIFIKNKYKCTVGYSDHTLDDLACINSVVMGAKVIEKHFTTDNNLPGADNAISMNPINFKEMVKKIKRTYLQIGKYDLKPTTYETAERKKRHRYFVSKKFIKKNSLFTIKNLNMKRLAYSQNAISSFEPEKIIKKKAKNNIEKDKVIYFNDIKK